jgi:cyanate permease
MQSASPRRWTALAVIALAQFMIIMDTSIIGVALPEIQTDLGFSAEDLSWVFNAYVVAFGGLLLLGGRLSDLFGAKRMFSAGWAILARLAHRRPGGDQQRRDRRPSGAGRRRGTDRTVSTDAAHDALRA